MVFVIDCVPEEGSQGPKRCVKDMNVLCQLMEPLFVNSQSNILHNSL